MINTVPPVRFTRGSLADKAQARRDARYLAQLLRLEALLTSVKV